MASARKPAATKAKKVHKKSGPPAHVPTTETRNQVKTMAGYGISQKDIGMMVGLGETQLRHHYRVDLSEGLAIANVNIGKSLYDHCVGRPAVFENGRMVREELKADRSVAIFLGKSRLGLRETTKVVAPGPEAGQLQTIDLDLSILDDDEFLTFMTLYEKARRRGRELAAGAGEPEA
jgi:hypothetical protein